MSEIRCISLTQPYATLIAMGEKRIETRSWDTSYRGLLAIHGSKRFPVEEKRRVGVGPFRVSLARAGYHCAEDLPIGAIVALCRLDNVLPTNPTNRDYIGRFGGLLSLKERAFGNYAPGRYAWVLKDVLWLRKPISAKGALGLWRPDEVVREQLEQEWEFRHEFGGQA